MKMRLAWARVVALFRREHLDRDLEDDIAAHLELAEREGMEAGLSAEEARRQARLRFGPVEPMKEAHRDRRGLPWLEVFWKDFRFGMTWLLRSPGFSVAAIGILALGIGGTAALFGVVDAALLQPPPFSDPERIVGVWEAPVPGSVNSTTPADFLAWRRAPVFEALEAEQPVMAAVNEGDVPVQLAGKMVTSDYFRVFGSSMTLGRTFAKEDEREAGRLLVLSHAAWQAHFGSDREIIGRQIWLDGEACQVIGVLAPGVWDRDDTKFWKLLTFTPQDLASALHRLTLMGRLRSGLSLTEARERMEAHYEALRSERVSGEDARGQMVLEPLSHLLVGSSLRRSVVIAFGAVLLVLVIACANVTNLLLMRGATRRTEMAIRGSLGAGRMRLMAQLLAESLALCASGGVAGLGFAAILIRVAKPVLAQSLPFTVEVQLNAAMLSFSVITIVAVTLISGILPAVQGSKGDLSDGLKRSLRSVTGAHATMRRAVVTGEIALSLVLVCGALLLCRSLVKLRAVDPAIRVENVLTGSLSLPATRYADGQRAALFYEQVSEALRRIPGTEEAGLSSALPLQWISNGEGIFVPGVAKPILVRRKRVDAGYFRALAIPVLTGRGISMSDRYGQDPVMVINEALAKRLAETAGLRTVIGRVVRLTGTDYLQRSDVMTDVQIVGVIRNERTAGPDVAEPPVAYVPLAQTPGPELRLVLRYRGQLQPLLNDVRKRVREVDPSMPLADLATLEQVQDENVAGVRRPAWLVGVFAGVAAVLASVGLFGVVSFWVVQRRKEISIRMALGARRSEVLAAVLRSGLVTVGIGVALGLGGVWALTRVLENLLFEVSPMDPLSMMAGCAGMLLIGVCASLVPAYRAAVLDAASVLRDTG